MSGFVLSCGAPSVGIVVGSREIIASYLVLLRSQHNSLTVCDYISELRDSHSAI